MYLNSVCGQQADAPSHYTIVYARKKIIGTGLCVGWKIKDPVKPLTAELLGVVSMTHRAWPYSGRNGLRPNFDINSL